MPNTDMQWEEAIDKVLEESGEPLHYTEIADRIIENGYRTSVGATPGNTVARYINPEIKMNKEHSKYVKVQPGIFTLRSMFESYSSSSDEETEEEKEESAVKTKMITTFGISWNRSFVLWKKNPDLFGVQTLGAIPVNFSDQIGIYLLYDGREIIYIGQAVAQPIGERLNQHTKDRLSGRWDRFSWFGFHEVNEIGQLKNDSSIIKDFSHETIADTLEAVLIESVEPRQNRKSGNKFSALEYIQQEDPEIKRKKARQVLEELTEKL